MTQIRCFRCFPSPRANLVGFNPGEIRTRILNDRRGVGESCAGYPMFTAVRQRLWSILRLHSPRCTPHPIAPRMGAAIAKSAPPHRRFEVLDEIYIIGIQGNLQDKHRIQSPADHPRLLFLIVNSHNLNWLIGEFVRRPFRGMCDGQYFGPQVTSYGVR